MELQTEFATFCNICFNKETLRKIEETEHLTKMLMVFIENKIVLKEQNIYLCLNCCEKLESYDQFKEMCLRNFVDFRIEYFELKKKLEKDPNVEMKLRDFIETKVYGNSDSIHLDDSEDPLKHTYNGKSLQESENKLTGKQDEGNDYNYNFHSVKCKTEKIEYEAEEDYELHNNLDIEDNGDDFILPVPIEHVKVESYGEEDMGAIESSINDELLNHSKTDELYDTTNKLMEHEKNESVNSANGNTQSTTKEMPDHECKICGKTFPYISNLNRHIRIHTGEKRHSCNICNKSFGEASHLKAHASVHIRENRYSCKMCTKKLPTKIHLKRHELLHTKEKTYICNICNRGYRFSHLLKYHMLSHTNEKPYTCLICNKSFKKLQSLKEHERVHTGEKPYACSMCDESFSSSSKLKSHELLHTGEKPYTCDVCNKSFSLNHNLNRHKRTHTDNKPAIKCSVCNKSFNTRSNLKNHEVVHAEEKRHTCSICSKRYHRLSRLKRHMLTHTAQ